MISVKWYVNKFLLDERRGGGQISIYALVSEWQFYWTKGVALYP